VDGGSGGGACGNLKFGGGEGRRTGEGRWRWGFALQVGKEIWEMKRIGELASELRRSEYQTVRNSN